jgi:hypothetical protein
MPPCASIRLVVCVRLSAVAGASYGMNAARLDQLVRLLALSPWIIDAFFSSMLPRSPVHAPFDQASMQHEDVRVEFC